MPDDYSAWTRRWLATSHRRQAKFDDLLDALDAAIRETLGGLASTLVRVWRTSPPAERSARADAIIRRRLDRILRALAATLSAGRDLARNALADAIPAALVPDLLGRLSPPQTIAEAVALSNDFDAVTPGTPSWSVAPLTPEQARQRIARMVLPPLDAQTLERTWRGLPRPTIAAMLFDRLSSRLWNPTAKLQIESQLTAGLAAGENVEQLTRRIRSSTSALTWQARRVARTEGRRALERDHLDRTLDALGDMVQGIMIQAVMDDRTRPEHAARHGAIYYRQADGSFRDKAGRPAPELPDAPNCRCTYVPVLTEPEFRSEVSRRAYETATGKLIPDLPTYQEVWEKADVRTRRRMIGASRYDALMGRCGAADPTLAMTADGRLVPVATLRTESILDAYDRRTALITRQLLGGQPEPAGVGTAVNAAIAGRVLARQDLPVGLTAEQLAAHIADAVPTPPSHATARQVSTAARRVVEVYAASAMSATSAAPGVLRDQVWRVIARSATAAPHRYDLGGVPDPGTASRVRQASTLIAQLLGRDLPPGRVIVLPTRHSQGGYDPAKDIIYLPLDAPLSLVVHEMMHRVDRHCANYRFGRAYARKMLSGRVVLQPTPSGLMRIQTRADGSAPLYYYQNHQPLVADTPDPGREFISTVAEQLVENPILAVMGDPKGFELWLRELRKLK